ncbi:MAG: hypothetical protein WC890_01335 [Candidatus Margulisiibacteriota bacterium]
MTLGNNSNVADLTSWANLDRRQPVGHAGKKDSREVEKQGRKDNLFNMSEDEMARQLNPTDSLFFTATTVPIMQQAIRAHPVLDRLDSGIDNLRENLKDSFKKSYGMGQTHNNLLVAMLHATKAAGIRVALFALGVSNEEISDLKQEAITASTQQAEALLQNTIESEVMTIVTASSPKAARKILNTIKSVIDALAIQFKKLGKPERVSDESLCEMRVKATQDLLDKFEVEGVRLTDQYPMLSGSESEVV